MGLWGPGPLTAPLFPLPTLCHRCSPSLWKADWGEAGDKAGDGPGKQRQKERASATEGG